MHDFVKPGCVTPCVAIIMAEYLNIADKGKRQGINLLCRHTTCNGLMFQLYNEL